jgi:nucleoside-diphosphate-sugar epimerase
MITIAITGASGFIGRAVTARAMSLGHRVRPLSRSGGALPSGYEDVLALARAFSGAEAVLHLAARAHRGGSDDDFECNVRAARAVASAALSAGVRRAILVSSIGVNGNVTHGRPFAEADVPAPVEPYARSKLRAEQEWQSLLGGTATQWVIVRPPLVYGAQAPGNFARLVRAVARGWPLPLGAVHNERSLIGVDNLADVLLACCVHDRAADELFLVADGDDLSTPEVIRCIARGLGLPAHLWNVPPAAIKFAARLARRARTAESLCDSLQVDTSKVRRTLGWSASIAANVGIELAARQS